MQFRVKIDMRNNFLLTAATFAAVLAVAGCGGKNTKATDAGESAAKDEKAAAPAAPASRWASDPFASTYAPYASKTTVIKGATILTGAGERIDNGVVVIENGKIAGVGGADLVSPAGAVVIDAKGKWMTPGIIDVHSHLGDYPSPSTESTSDGNEATAPNTSQVRSEERRVGKECRSRWSP